MAQCTRCRIDVPMGAARCPKCGSTIGQSPPPVKRSATVVESVDRLRPPAESGYTPTRKVPRGDKVETVEEAVTFRPIFRPPVALLTVLDDGRDQGESYRLRNESTIIGRANSDVVVANDLGISGTHAVIERRNEDGRWRWYLKDLDSTNGTFVRIAKSILRHNQDLLIGGKRFRFSDAQTIPTGSAELNDSSDSELNDGTRPWQAIKSSDLAGLLPCLIEQTNDGDGTRYLLDRPVNVIGSDPSKCSIVLTDDPFVSPQHCKCFKNERGRWKIENTGSINGVWLRVRELCVVEGAEFQLGEQRFTLRVL